MIWDCVTCGACVEACPVSIEHVDHIVDLRRHLVMVESSFPAEAEPMLRDVERASNPWGKPQAERAAWADELGVRVLEPGDPRAGVPLLGRLRGVVRRAGAQSRRSRRRRCCRRRASTSRSSARASPAPATRRGGWATSTSSRRSREQNVATLDGAGRNEDRRELPALLQHAGERVPRLRRQLRGPPPQRAARASSCARAGSSRRLRASRSPTTTRAIWRATTTFSMPRASSSPPSGSRSR